MFYKMAAYELGSQKQEWFCQYINLSIYSTLKWDIPVIGAKNAQQSNKISAQASIFPIP